ncbi:MAG: TonB-dependent receptor [Raineya sp.]
MPKFFLLYIFFLATLKTSGQCLGSIHGHLYEKSTKVSLTHAKVLLEEAQQLVQTDMQGEFLFKNVCEGTYHLLIFQEGYDTLRLKVFVSTRNLHYHKDIFLTKSMDFVEAISVEASKEASISSQIAQQISKQDWENARGKTLGEMLKSIAGVQSLSTGAGISKPMIHGLHSQRVLLLNNGIRQEGQQWGEDHAPEIDPFAIEQVSVLKGAAGVRYGSDAVAGVVLLNPKGMPTSHRLSGKAYLVGHSNSQMGNIALLTEKAFGKHWAWRLQSSAKRGGDFHTPTYVLSNTGIKEVNFAGALAYTAEKFSFKASASRFASDIGILRASHTGNINDLAISIQRPQPWFVEPFSYQIRNPRQNIIHYLGKLETAFELAHLGKLELQYAYQHNARREYDIRRGGRSEIPALSLLLQTHTFDAVLEHHAWRDFRGSFGINTLFQTNYNIPETGIIPLLPDFTNFTQGVFWIEKFIQKNYEIEWGLRYDYRHTQVRTFIQNREYIKPEYNFHFATATLGYSYYGNEKFSFKTNIGTTFRPPHTAELFSQGLHLGIGNLQEGLLFENGFINPNKSFEIEKAYKWVASTIYKHKNWELDLSPYLSFIDNFIYLTPTDIRLTIRGTFPVFSYQQDAVLMRGIDLMSRYSWGKFYWESKWAYLKAHVIKDKSPLINMPPLRIENKIAFTQKEWKGLKNIETYISFLNVARQYNAPRVVNPEVFEGISQEEKAKILQEGNFDFMKAPASYFLLGAGIEADYQKFRFSLKAENILNTVYRDYLNRWRYYANDLGRNFIIQLNYTF